MTILKRCLGTFPPSLYLILMFALPHVIYYMLMSAPIPKMITGADHLIGSV